MTKRNLNVEELLKRNPQVDREQLERAIALLKKLSKEALMASLSDPVQYSRIGAAPKPHRQRPVKLRTRL